MSIKINPRVLFKLFLTFHSKIFRKRDENKIFLRDIKDYDGKVILQFDDKHSKIKRKNDSLNQQQISINLFILFSQ
jgi:hypothetical protein